MLPITGYAPLNGWKQVGAPHWAFMEAHTFEASPAGELLHFTNGELRATVPPEGFADYLELWPMAQPIVDGITGKRPASWVDPLTSTTAAPGDASSSAEPVTPIAVTPPAEPAAPADAHGLAIGEMPSSAEG